MMSNISKCWVNFGNSICSIHWFPFLAKCFQAYIYENYFPLSNYLDVTDEMYNNTNTWCLQTIHLNLHSLTTWSFPPICKILPPLKVWQQSVFLGYPTLILQANELRCIISIISVEWWNNVLRSVNGADLWYKKQNILWMDQCYWS